MRRLTTASALVAALLLGACSSSGTGASTATTGGGPADRTSATDDVPDEPVVALPPADPELGPGDLEWATCNDEAVALCTTVSVPLDHEAPDGPTLDLAVELVPATDRDDRIGVLWWNPGGPGEPGVSGYGGIADSVPQSVRDRFDVATFDPRGVGQSAPVQCGPEGDATPEDLSPDDADEVAVVLAQGRKVADGCAAASAALLPHLGTQSVARDLDLLRQAVGDDQLTYVGMSYGTVIGQEYLSLFPDEVRAIVLDGVVDVEPGWEQRWIDMAQGRELAFDRFLDWCSTTAECAFHNDGDPAGAFDALMTRLDGEPLVVGDEVIDQASVEGELSQSIYGGEDAWPAMARSLDLYARRDVACLSDDACRLGEEHPGGPAEDGPTEELPDDDEPFGFDGELDDDFSEQYADALSNTSHPFEAVTCVDWPSPRDDGEYLAAAERVAAAAPRFGPALAWAQATCIHWGADAIGLLVPGDDVPTPLVVSTTHDPATPLVHAQQVAARLGAPLLTVDSARHVIFPSGAACVDDTVTDYLVTTELPDDTRCPMP